MVIARNKRIGFNNPLAAGPSQPVGTGIIELTYEEAKILKQTSAIISGKYYLITSSLTRTLINTKGPILLLGVSDNTFSLDGTYYALLPDYKTLPVWSPGTMVSIVIYDGKTWEMTNEDPIAPGLSSSWTELPNTISETDKIEYDFDNDWINLRADKRTNVVSGGRIYENGWGNGFNIIEKFQWGNDLHYGNYIQDSAVDILNISGQFSENRLVSNSEFSGNTLGIGSLFGNNEFSRSSFSGNILGANVYFTNNYSVNGWMGNNTFSAGYIVGNQITGGSLSRNIMDAGFLAYNNIFPNGSLDDNFIASQSSSISGNTLHDNATINNNRLESTANYIYGNELGPHSAIRQNQLKAHTNYISYNKLAHYNHFADNILAGTNIFMSQNELASGAWVSNKTFGDHAGLEANKIDFYWVNALNLNLKIAGGTLRSGFSNMEATLIVTGQTTFSLLQVVHAGRIILNTINTEETINQITGIDNHHPFRFYPAVGKIITMQRTAISILASHGRLIMDSDIVLDGNNGDYAVFEPCFIKKGLTTYTCLKLISFSISS